jgi:small subunit ribosomal protein S24e
MSDTEEPEEKEEKEEPEEKAVKEPKVKEVPLVINIKEVKENKLLRRKEISFEIDHLGAGSPKRFRVKEKLAAMQTADPDLTFIKYMTTIYGLPKVKGYATVYEDEKIAKKLEAPYIHIRNMPDEKRLEARKALKAKNKGKKTASKEKSKK